MGSPPVHGFTVHGSFLVSPMEKEKNEKNRHLNLPYRVSRLHDPSLLCAAASSRGVERRLQSRLNRLALCRSRNRPSEVATAKYCPYFARVGEAHSELGDTRPLASHGASHRVRSCTKSPELPSVAIGSVGMPPTPFGGCQRRLERRSGGSEKPETVKETPSRDLRCITRVATTMRQARRHS